MFDQIGEVNSFRGDIGKDADLHSCNISSMSSSKNISAVLQGKN